MEESQRAIVRFTSDGGTRTTNVAVLLDAGTYLTYRVEVGLELAQVPVGAVLRDVVCSQYGDGDGRFHFEPHRWDTVTVFYSSPDPSAPGHRVVSLRPVA